MFVLVLPVISKCQHLPRVLHNFGCSPLNFNNERSSMSSIILYNREVHIVHYYCHVQDTGLKSYSLRIASLPYCRDEEKILHRWRCRKEFF